MMDKRRFKRLMLILGDGGSEAGTRLVAPAFLSSFMSLTRTQASSAMTTALAPDGLLWPRYSADTARFYGPAQRLLIEGGRTNSNRNPRGEGAAAPSTLPTYWAVDVAAGMTTEVLSNQVIGNVETVTLRNYGTASGASFALRFEDLTQVVATPSSAWAAGFHARLDATPAAPNSYSVRIIPRTAAGVGIAGGITSAAFTPDGTLRRYTHGTTSIGSGVTTARVTSEYRSVLTIGQSYDWTITLGWPTLEAGSFATTPILPPVGTPAATTRGADLISEALADLGIGANGACTVLWSGVIPQNASSSAAQSVIEIDAGAIANRFLIRNDAGGAAINLYRVTAGAGASASVGSMTAGTAMRIGLSIDGAGRAAASRDGGAVGAVTGGPSSGLTTLRLGVNAAGTENMFGEAGHFRVLPYAVSDGELQNLVSGMPL